MGRIADWIASQSAAARFRRLERETREVLAECVNMLEKLNTMSARLAKREARARRAADDAAQEAARAPNGDPGHIPPLGDLQAVKTALRARAFGRSAQAPPPNQLPEA